MHTTPQSWKLYPQPAPAWEAMLEACERATKSIDFEQFIFISDEIGQRFIDVCARKASQGVRVRFLLDAAGSFSLFGALLVSDLSKKGIQIGFFNTLIPRAIHNHKWWFFRNHRRSLIIDETIAFTGSHCIWNYTREWRDTSVRLQGEVVEEIHEAFSIMWDRAHGIKKDWGYERPLATEGFNYVTNSPVRAKRFMYQRLIDAIRNARRYIFLTTPYFVPDRRLLRVLRLAAHRGVDVRLLIPVSSDHPIVDLGAQSFFSKLLKAGVKIYRHKNTFIHSKTVIIDDDWSTIGTLNLDHVSLLYNFEANIVSSDKDFAAELKGHFLNDLTHSERLAPDRWERRDLTQKILEFLVRFVRQFL